MLSRIRDIQHTRPSGGLTLKISQEQGWQRRERRLIPCAATDTHRCAVHEHLAVPNLVEPRRGERGVPVGQVPRQRHLKLPHSLGPAVVAAVRRVLPPVLIRASHGQVPRRRGRTPANEGVDGLPAGGGKS